MVQAGQRWEEVLQGPERQLTDVDFLLGQNMCTRHPVYWTIRHERFVFVVMICLFDIYGL